MSIKYEKVGIMMRNELDELEVKFTNSEHIDIVGEIISVLNPITIEMLQEQLEIFKQSTYNEVNYKISEDFGSNHNYEYTLKNIYCEVETDIDGNKGAYFSDKDECIYEIDVNVLIGFIVNDRCKIYCNCIDCDESLLYIDGKFIVEIVFPDGVIKIEKIN